MFPDLWKAELLVGIVPAKTTQYAQKENRAEINYLYFLIGKVKFIGITKEEVMKSLIKYNWILNQICENIYFTSKPKGKKKVTKVEIHYYSYSRPRFVIKNRANKIIVFVPTNLDEEW